MDILNYKTSDSTHTLTSRAGLVAVGELARRLELNGLVDVVSNFISLRFLKLIRTGNKAGKAPET